MEPTKKQLKRAEKQRKAHEKFLNRVAALEEAAQQPATQEQIAQLAKHLRSK